MTYAPAKAYSFKGCSVITGSPQNTVRLCDHNRGEVASSMVNLINILRGKVPAERSGTVIKGWLKPTVDRTQNKLVDSSIFLFSPATVTYSKAFSSFEVPSTIHPSPETHPPPATMKTAFLQLALAALSYGYVVNVFKSWDCTGVAATYDLASSGDCSGIPAGLSVSYQSDIGCVLSTYSSSHCGGAFKAVTRSQNKCFTPGYQITGVICH